MKQRKYRIRFKNTSGIVIASHEVDDAQTEGAMVAYQIDNQQVLYAMRPGETVVLTDLSQEV